ncbi:MAG: BatA domain-containing protein [Planctomycetota bacterium]
MTFFNASLLIGTLLATIPIALHLLARRKPKRVIFPTVRFLTERLSQQHSRLRIRRWWLLALRVVALVGMALALARPHILAASVAAWSSVGLLLSVAVVLLLLASVAWSRSLPRWIPLSLAFLAIASLMGSGLWAAVLVSNSSGPTPGVTAPIAIAIVIDNGPTSSRTDGTPDNVPDDASRLQSMVRRASQIVARIPDTSQIAIVDRSATPTAFTLDKVSALSALERLKPNPSPLDLTSRISSAWQLTRTSELPQRHVVVLSDMRRVNWPQGTSIQKPTDTSEQSEWLTLIDITKSTPEAETSRSPEPLNRTVSPPRVDPVIAPRTSIPVEVNVALDAAPKGDAVSQRNIAIELSLYRVDASRPQIRDGSLLLPNQSVVDRKSVALAPGANANVSLSLPPLDRGTHHATVSLVGEDPFAADDRRFLTIRIGSSARILLVGQSDLERRVMATAICAPKEVDDPDAAYQIDSIQWDDLVATEPSDYDGLVLLDPPLRVDQQGLVAPRSPLTFQRWQQIASASESGTGIAILMGPQLEFDPTLNHGNADEVGRAAFLLPKLRRVWRTPRPGTFLRVAPTRHPLTQPLLDVEPQPIWSAYRVRLHVQAVPSNDWSTLATWNDEGHPAIMSASPGSPTDAPVPRGPIAVMTTPLPALVDQTRPWNDFFVASDSWPAFLLTRTLAQWTCGSQEMPSTVPVGTAGDFVIPTLPKRSLQRAGTSSESVAVETLTWFRPGSVNPTVLPARTSPDGEASKRVEVTRIDEVGTHFVRGGVFWGGFSANLDPKWSSDTPVDRSSLTQILGDTGWQWLGSNTPLDLSGRGDLSPVSLHGPIMLLVVIAFLLEQFLSNRFYQNDSKPRPSWRTSSRTAAARRASA